MSGARPHGSSLLRIAALAAGLGVVSAQGSGGTATAREDGFLVQRDTEAALHASHAFTVAIDGDRRTFRPGEAIPLVFTFRRHDVSPYAHSHCRGLGMAEAVLDSTDGTADPQRDRWDNGVVAPDCGVVGGVVGAAPGVAPLIRFEIELNRAVRFDRPGRYRFYVRSRHRFPFFERGRVPLLVSNVIELEITGRDRAWEARTLAASLEVLETARDDAARRRAARAISYLGTEAAVDVMVRRLGRSAVRPAAAAADPDSVLRDEWLFGVYGSPYREAVVAGMERELAGAEHPVAPWFVTHLTVLRLTAETGERPLPRARYEAVRSDYARRAPGR